MQVLHITVFMLDNNGSVIRDGFAGLTVCRSAVVVADHAAQKEQHFAGFFFPQSKRIQRREGLTDADLHLKQRIVQRQIIGRIAYFFLFSEIASAIVPANQP